MKSTATHVTVIGAGIIGTSICYYLAKKGIDVALIERKGLVAGTSGACGGYVGLQTKDTGGKLPLTLESRKIFENLENELGENIEYKERPGMIIVETEEEWNYIASLAERLRKNGVRIELLDRQSLRARQPGLRKEVLGATLSLDDCEVNPIRLTIGFAVAAKKKGAKIFTRSNVESIQVENGKVCSVETDRFRIHTKIIINAAGVWAPHIGRMVGLDIPVTPRRGMLIVTEPLPPLINGYIISARSLVKKMSPFTEDPTAEGRDRVGGGVGIAQHQNGNIVSGTTREFAGYDRGTTYEGVSFISEELVRIFPKLRHTHVIRTFAGLRPFTPDGLPILSSVAQPEGFFIATGHEGDGIALAPITGQLIARLIADKERPEALALLNFSRFYA